MFLFLTVLQAIIAAALVGVILMQQSEGGGLGVGGSPGGMMSARGAADLLTRTTKYLAVAFVVLSIALAAIAVETSSGDAIETTLDRETVPAFDPLAPTDVPTTPQPQTGVDGDAPDAPDGAVGSSTGGGADPLGDATN